MLRFFKCNVLGGFRISDLNKSIKQNDYFYIEDHICDTSRAVRAAIANNWMKEIDEEEASQYITIPKVRQYEKETEQETKRKLVKTEVSLPHVETKTLESRQAEKSVRKQAAQKQTKEEKVILPDFNKADIAIKARQQDITTKGPDETLPSPVESKKKDNNVITTIVDDDTLKSLADNEFLSIPNFDERKEEVKTELTNKISEIISRKKRNLPAQETV